MPVVNGVLEKCNLSKKKTGYNLKGAWDDGDDWHWIPKASSRPLFEAGVVVQDGTFDDGNPKFNVVGSPPVGISTEFKGKDRVVTVILGAVVDDEAGSAVGGNPWDVGVSVNVAEIKAQSAVAAKPQASQSAVVERDNRRWWADLMACDLACLRMAKANYKEVMGEDPTGETLHARAATLLIQAKRDGLTAPTKQTQKAPTPPPEDEPPLPDEEEETDLPF